MPCRHPLGVDGNLSFLSNTTQGRLVPLRNKFFYNQENHEQSVRVHRFQLVIRPGFILQKISHFARDRAYHIAPDAAIEVLAAGLSG